MARDLVTGTVEELSPPGTETGPTHSRGSPAGDVGGSVGFFDLQHQIGFVILINVSLWLGLLIMNAFP